MGEADPGRNCDSSCERRDCGVDMIKLSEGDSSTNTQHLESLFARTYLKLSTLQQSYLPDPLFARIRWDHPNKERVMNNRGILIVNCGETLTEDRVIRIFDCVDSLRGSNDLMLSFKINTSIDVHA